jgi:cytochrome c oxidase cbb3-type subunit III
MRYRVGVVLVVMVPVAMLGSTTKPRAKPAATTVVRQQQAPAPSLTNPYAGNARAIDEGSKLFVSYNCADCHGAGGSGLVGPSFQDNRWRYGGSAGEVFTSIKAGRPEGMPVWGKFISDDQIWRLVAYVQSLGAGKDFTTENFTEVGVKRTGH